MLSRPITPASSQTRPDTLPPTYLVMDCEIVESIQKGSDIWSHPWDLTISVACTIDHKGRRRHFLGEEPGGIKKMLELFDYYDLVVGFNSVRFDMRLVDGSMGWMPDAVNAKLHGKHVDILLNIEKYLGHRVKLAQVGEALGAPKTEDGAMAPVMWRNGERERVINYCYQDVEITRRAFALGTLEHRLPFMDKGVVRWVRIPTWVRS